MTKLVISDLHLTDKPRDSYRFDFFEFLHDIASGARVTEVLVLGDITEEKDRHPAWLVNEVVYQFSKLAELAILTNMRGNHDYLDAANPFFAFLAHLERSRYINRPTGVGDALFLPHTHDYKNEWPLEDFGSFRTIFAHNTFDGAISEHGAVLKGIPTSIFPRGVQVYSGDVHRPQEVGPVIYVGAPYHIRFGDDFAPRMLLLHNGQPAESVPVPGPEKHIVQCAAGDKLPLDSKDIIKRLRKGDMLEVRVQIDQRHTARWAEIRSEVHKWGERHGFVIYAVKPIVDRGGKREARRAQTAPKSDPDLLVEYAKREGLDEHTETAGLNIIKST